MVLAPRTPLATGVRKGHAVMQSGGGLCRPPAKWLWQQREMNMALERQAKESDFPVIPLLLPSSDPVLGFLGQNTWVDFRTTPDDPKLITILAAAIRGEFPGPDAREWIQETVATVCPYRGLLYFREEDAPFFFGRGEAIEQLVQAMSGNSFLAVVGASGSGKSSVVRAGLVPALRRSRDNIWEVLTLVPGGLLPSSLARCCTRPARRARDDGN